MSNSQSLNRDPVLKQKQLPKMDGLMSQENRWIDRFIKKQRQTGARPILGVGDDCSVIKVPPGSYWIESTDALFEGTHFLRSQMRLEDLGYKALAVNISDILAMGGQPRHVHLTLGLPSDVQEAELKSFFKGFFQLANKVKVSLIGGDLCRSQTGWVVSIHISGVVSPAHLQKRTDFKKSHWLCVTGFLGDSAGGFNCLTQDSRDSQKYAALCRAHHRPSLDFAETQWLAQQPGVSGMMDLSDGLNKDLQRLKPLGFTVHLESLPISKVLNRYCDQHQLSPYDFALNGGEDYKILFGVKKTALDGLEKKYHKRFGKKFYVIGNRSNRLGLTHWMLNGKSIHIKSTGFEHFNGSKN